MALSGSTVWEVRTTGNDLNGGGFVSGGTDYSQQDAAQKAGADLTMHASTNTDCYPAAAGVAAEDVGNLIYIASGTGWTPGFYEIKSIQTTYWRLDRSPSAAGNANLATYKMGGALASPGMIGGVLVNGNLVYVKYGTYTITTASTNVSTGCLATSTVAVTMVSYDTTRTPGNTDANHSTLVINAGVSTSVISNGSRIYFYKFIFDGAGQTSSRGLTGANAIHCKFQNFTNSGFQGNAIDCEITGCSTQPAVTASNCWGCVAHDNTVAAFSNSNTVDCIADTNTGASSDGFVTTGGIAVGCVSYANGRDGFRSASRGTPCVNCVAEGNAGYGFYGDAGYHTRTINCAGYNNTSGITVNTDDQDLITVTTGSVFTDPANADFSLNNTTGRGASLRAAGYPSTFPGESWTNYRDIGAAQHADPAGGGGRPELRGANL